MVGAILETVALSRDIFPVFFLQISCFFKLMIADSARDYRAAGMFTSFHILLGITAIRTERCQVYYTPGLRFSGVPLEQVGQEHLHLLLVPLLSRFFDRATIYNIGIFVEDTVTKWWRHFYMDF
jgi:hypothetical protein